jgi:4-amino-4-deoxy-L-arabinose transferase-like glycosyltransferase
MLDAVAALVATVLLATTAGAVALALGARRGPVLVPAALVVAAAAVVVQTIALSLLGAYTQGGLLVAGAVCALVAAGAWRRAGSPRPYLVGARMRSGELGIAVRANPEVALLVGVAVVALVVQAIVAVAFPPSNNDSLTYHLSRAAYWLQYQSATPFPGGSVRQLDSPPNGEMLQGWTLAVAGTDRFAALVQWLSLVGVACCIHLGARLLRFSCAPALFAAGLFVVLPQPIMQATSTQNDLIAAFLVVATAVFGVRGLRRRRGGDLAIAAIAAGVAVGTKGTVLALVPSLGIILAVEAWCVRPPRRLVLGGLAATAAAVLVLGSWGYVQNLAHGQPLLGGLTGKTERTSPLAQNAVRTLWTFADSPGIRVPVIGGLVPEMAHAAGQRFEGGRFHYAIDTAVSEDLSAYGLVGWLVLLPLLSMYALLGRPRERAVWAGAALVGLAAFAVAFEYNPWIGRLLVPTVALAAPLLAGLAARRAVAMLAVVAALVVLWPSLTDNFNKPLLKGPESVQHMDRISQMTTARPDVDTVAHSLERLLRHDETLAFVGTEDSADYPYFGEHRQRRVVRFAAPPAPSAAELRATGARVALFANTDPPPAALRPEMILPGYWFVEVR